jgi:hypothetical protein
VIRPARGSRSRTPRPTVNRGRALILCSRSSPRNWCCC